MVSLVLKRHKHFDLPIHRPKEWVSHMMAPAPRLLSNNGDVEVFVGGWNAKGISSIYSVELNLEKFEIKEQSSLLRLSPGQPGSFDENGVFPASVINFNHEWYLSYTGFQLGHQIPHFNFGGLAFAVEGEAAMKRYSQAPIIDRADEGLSVRAGLTSIELAYDDTEQCLSAYAAGSTFEFVNGKLRPNYDVYTQTNDPRLIQKQGQLTIKFNEEEHGVGRPYLLKAGNGIWLFYTRRMKNFSYLPGVAYSDNGGKSFSRLDHLLNDVTPRINGFDDEMQYFPAPIFWNDSIYVLYNGNNFGEKGMGIWEFRLT